MTPSSSSSFETSQKSQTWVVTLDGPSASGKSTLSRELAKHFGWSWVSTGAFYRGLALASRRLKLDPTREDLLAHLCADSAIWSVQLFPDRTRVFFQSEDVTDLISQEDVGMTASQISHFPEVRRALLAAQRDCARGIAGLVAEGRDCGTVVFPDAFAKIYLTANHEHRVQRRAKELGLNTADLTDVQKKRDEQDSRRQASPLVTPEDALTLDTTELDLPAALQELIQFIEHKQKIFTSSAKS